MKVYHVNINGKEAFITATTEKGAIIQLLKDREIKPQHVAAGRLYHCTIREAGEEA